jgi:purine-binding chemotaxis protein CheW
MELRTRFALERKEDTDRTCIVVVEVTWKENKVTVGFLVDEVREVTEITEQQIEATPSMGTVVDEALIMGTGKVNDKVVMLLDVDQVLEGSNLSSVF